MCLFSLNCSDSMKCLCTPLRLKKKKKKKCGSEKYITFSLEPVDVKMAPVYLQLGNHRSV